MSTYLPFIALALVLSTGCDTKPAPKQDDAAAKSSASTTRGSETGPYAAYEFPAITDDWDHEEYGTVWRALVNIDKNQPELLVTLAGPKGDILARFASPESVGKAIAKAPDMGSIRFIVEPITEIYGIYAARVHAGQPYSAEYLLLTRTLIRSATGQFARVVSSVGEAKLHDDIVGRAHLMEMRAGMFLAYVSALTAPLQVPGTVEAHAAMVELAAAADDIAPFLVPDERQLIDQVLTLLTAMGADPAQVASARASIYGATLHPLIAAFVSEARLSEYQQRNLDRVLDDQYTIDRGPESGGIRYVFSDADFSAVFQQEPNAILTKSSESDGATLTTRMLGTRDEAGHGTALVCISPSVLPTSDDGRSFARKMIERTKATDILEVKIDGHKGFEAAISSSTSSGFIQTVDLERGGCMIIVESPPQLADSYKKQARAFLRSAKFDDFEG
jgi:hypothetical protein